MLFSLLFATAAFPYVTGQVPTAPPQIDRSSRLRRTLSNGASVGAERWPGASRIVFQAVLTNPEGDRRSGYGHRHLLEHLVASRDPQLDLKIETLGGALGAQTSRETMRFWVSVPPEGFALGFEAMRALLKPITLSEEEVARERKILSQEIALLTDEERTGQSLWSALYGEGGLDPIGTETDFSDASPAALERLWRGLLQGSRLSLFVAGPVELDPTVDQLERLARTFPAASEPMEWSARTIDPEAISSSSGSYGLSVGPIDSPATLAALATGLALASEVEGSSVTYTPSPRNGVVIISNSAAGDELRSTLR